MEGLFFYDCCYVEEKLKYLSFCIDSESLVQPHESSSFEPALPPHTFINPSLKLVAIPLLLMTFIYICHFFSSSTYTRQTSQLCASVEEATLYATFVGSAEACARGSTLNQLANRIDVSLLGWDSFRPKAVIF